MKADALMIKYGELALKKRNRRMFEDRLMHNIRQKLQSFSGIELQKTFGRIFVHLNGTEARPVIEALQQVFGLVGISPVITVDLDLAEIKRVSLALMEKDDLPGTTFKIAARRANKAFPHQSQEMNHLVGRHVLKGTDHLKVDVHEPDVTLSIEVRSRHAYVYNKSFPGLGGLPVGVSGKVMLLLSGGIDSPVAGYLALKRGVEVEAVHFHSFPYTSERSLKKVEQLAGQLTTFAGRLTLHTVPFTDIQTNIRETCEESFSITIMRRFMFRIAEELAKDRGALAIATGESIGQVASQTLESMRAINDVVSMPVLRPLTSMDKQEIITLAKQIGTYETSILPYEDCCTIFMPKSPQTRPNLERTRKNERGLDIERLVAQAVKQTTSQTFTPHRKQEFASYFA